MKVLARALSKHTGHTHLVCDEELAEERFRKPAKGNLLYRVPSGELTLSGRYILTVELDPQEIARIYNDMVLKPLKDELADLKATLAKLQTT
ncbi:hypothetical protein [Phyllobacterium sophorae]|uniref:Uncharacterized protein n=1 Tax=Phyllobacterium sophorae TaxID=1520277 RepID=A0A2P7AQ23_9HYPH|nr:hypothetical protein [Phyllobacterium sophorae]PSH56311.1 hypothetical protein CU103_30085 [Phyllobacterium sophorae]